MTTTIAKGLLNLEMTNIYPEEIEKLRNYFVQLIEPPIEIHRFKNGKIIMNFNDKGLLMNIEVQYIPWKRKKGLDKVAGSVIV